MSDVTYEQVYRYIEDIFGDDSFSKDKFLFHNIATKLAMLAQDFMNGPHWDAVVYANTKWRLEDNGVEFNNHLENVGREMDRLYKRAPLDKFANASNRLAFCALNKNAGMEYDSADLLVDCCEKLALRAEDVLHEIIECYERRSTEPLEMVK